MGMYFLLGLLFLFLVLREIEHGPQSGPAVAPSNLVPEAAQ
jgi:hypothetical protein